MNLDISIRKFWARPLLWLSQFFNDNYFVVVCKGYGDDWRMYTGLYWRDDKDNDLRGYEDFRVWVSLFSFK